MKQILGFSTSNKKFSPQQEEKLKQKFMDLSKQTEDLERKGVEYIDHCRTIRELLSVTFWVFVVDHLLFSQLHNFWLKEPYNLVISMQSNSKRKKTWM
jgi:hypothetical protein